VVGNLTVLVGCPVRKPVDAEVYRGTVLVGWVVTAVIGLVTGEVVYRGTVDWGVVTVETMLVEVEYRGIPEAVVPTCWTVVCC